MFLCVLVIELGMRLISAFPVDTIAFMFFVDINSDALLCLLVLVKKIIKGQNCHIIMARITLYYNNSISSVFFKKKRMKPRQNW